MCEYSDACILYKGFIAIPGHGDDAAKQADERNKVAIFENCNPFREYIS